MEKVNLFVDHEDIVLTENGVWLSNGEEITHRAQAEAFFKSIHHDKDGYFLKIGNNEKRIEVRDTAYFVTGVEGSPKAGYHLRLSDGEIEKLNPKTLKYRPGRLTALVKRNDHKEEAKFLHTPYFEVLKNIQEDKNSYFIRIESDQVTLSPK